MDWLRNMHDWMISKKRYYGLALPIYECDECGHFTVIGEQRRAAKNGPSKAGMNSRATRRTAPTSTPSKSPAPNAAARSRRIKDVGNPWLDAGIVGIST